MTCNPVLRDGNMVTNILSISSVIMTTRQLPPVHLLVELPTASTTTKRQRLDNEILGIPSSQDS